jgi:membrane-associated phospholipid phosphatase
MTGPAVSSMHGPTHWRQRRRTVVAGTRSGMARPHRSRFPRVAIAAALGAFGSLFAIVKANRSAAFDLAFTLKLQGLRSPVLHRVMRAASWPGFPPQSRLIPPLVVGGWLIAGRPAEAAAQLAGWGTAAASTGVKAMVRRPRPLPPAVRVVVAPLGGSSFPSGHVLTYVGFYGTLAYLLARTVGSPPVRAAAVAGPLALVALVGPSRIEEGHHWATDVLASYLLGLAYVLALVQLYERAVTR